MEGEYQIGMMKALLSIHIVFWVYFINYKNKGIELYEN